jgi:serine/threonine protein kinase
VVIADFDTVRQIDQGTNKYTNCGTDGYKSPEVMGDEKYGVHSDIWSLGVVMIELMLGSVYGKDIGYKMGPRGEHETHIHNEIKDALQNRGTYSDDLIAKVLEMISFSPSSRGTAYDIHEWCEKRSNILNEEDTTDDDIYEWCKKIDDIEPNKKKRKLDLGDENSSSLSEHDFNEYKLRRETEIMEENVMETKIELFEQRGVNLLETIEYDDNNIIRLFSKNYKIVRGKPLDNGEEGEPIVHVVSNPIYPPPRVVRPMDSHTRENVTKLCAKKERWHSRSEESKEHIRMWESLVKSEENKLLEFVSRLHEIDDEQPITLEMNVFKELQKKDSYKHLQMEQDVTTKRFDVLVLDDSFYSRMIYFIVNSYRHDNIPLKHFVAG